MSRLTKFVAGAIVMAGLGFAGMNTAQAGGYGYVPHCHYETVITWQLRTIKDVIYITKYDDCGHPYEVAKVIYKTVKVPVKKLVKVCH